MPSSKDGVRRASWAVGRGALEVHQVVSDTEASSDEPEFRVYDEPRDVPVLHVLLWTTGYVFGYAIVRAIPVDLFPPLSRKTPGFRGFE